MAVTMGTLLAMPIDEAEEELRNLTAPEHAPSLHERLLSVWEKCAYVFRDADTGNFTAASYDAVVSKIRPFLIEAGVLCYPDPDSFVAEANSAGEVFVRVGMRFVNAHDPKDFIVIPSFSIGATGKYISTEQLAGSVQTYAYKSALRYGLLLETGDDPDLEARPYGPDIPEEIQEKIDLIRELGQVPADEANEGDVEAYIRTTLEVLCQAYGRPVRGIESLSEPMLDRWIAKLQNPDAKPKKKTKAVKPKPRADPKDTAVVDPLKVPKEARFQKLVDYMKDTCDAHTAGDRIVNWLAERKMTVLSLKEDKPWLRAWDVRDNIASG